MRLRLALLAAPTLALGACSAPSPGAAPGSSAPAQAATGTGVVAEVDGGPILGSELESRAANRLVRVRQEEYEIRRQALDEMIGERLVAAQAQKAGVPAEELLKREVDAKAELPSDTELASIYEQNKARFGSAPRDEAIARIREILSERAISERRTAYLNELRAGARVAVRLEPPRAAVAIPAGAPATGPASAPVTIVEFTDYQCPYCHRAQTVIDQVLQRYAGKVRFVHLDYPLDIHPEAVPAARAARCAGEQGKFWEYHRSLMVRPGTLDLADLKGRASTLSLDGSRFASCLASEKYDTAIQGELRQGVELGVSGTPAYFVNGRLLSGARPLESFVEVIDSELNPPPGD